jgi:16S rRNA (guanine966-N2)-methyltransferase
MLAAYWVDGKVMDFLRMSALNVRSLGGIFSEDLPTADYCLLPTPYSLLPVTIIARRHADADLAQFGAWRNPRGGIDVLRIIGGEQRGRKIEIPRGDVRPPTDRVRQAIFNMLRQLVPGRPAFDLFAGSGALGLEALSRGASRATFIESDARVTMTLRQNVKHLHYEDRCTVVVTDAFHWAQRFSGWPREPAIVLVAPPYAMFERRLADLQLLLAILIDRLPNDTAIALQAPQDFQRDSLPVGADWELRRYGQTQAVIGQTQKSGVAADTSIDAATDESDGGGDRTSSPTPDPSSSA